MFKKTYTNFIQINPWFLNVIGASPTIRQNEATVSDASAVAHGYSSRLLQSFHCPPSQMWPTASDAVNDAILSLVLMYASTAGPAGFCLRETPFCPLLQTAKCLGLGLNVFLLSSQAYWYWKPGQSTFFCKKYIHVREGGWEGDGFD